MTEAVCEIPNGTPNGQCDVVNDEDIKEEPKVFEVSPEADDQENAAASEGESDASEESADSAAMEPTSPKILEGKRERKQVQRLSETLNRAYEARVEKQASISKKMLTAFESGKGEGLGDIPLIEATLTKTKAIELKPLHAMIFGRSGTLSEVKGNIRRFHGFAFEANSPEYTKKLTSISQRSVSEIREALRILHLEVSGSREQIAHRLLNFLLKPTADVVKYKGKLVRKSSRGRPRKSEAGGKTEEKKTKGKRGRPRKVVVDKTAASTTTTDSQVDYGDSSSDDDDGDDGQSEDSLSSVDESSPPPSKAKRGRKPGSLTSAKRSKVISSDDGGADEPPVKPKAVVEDDEEDEDVPLTALTNKTQQQPPTDEELRDRVIKLLQTVNLEETSLKVVRERIFAHYPDIDLTEKKGFINATVKEYLSKS